MKGRRSVALAMLLLFVEMSTMHQVHRDDHRRRRHHGVVALATTAAATPAIFVFGDSLVDAGNNNYLNRSLAKAFNWPNGIDFPVPNASHPTGRFTNGLTVADLIAMKLGMETVIPPFLAPTTRGAALLNGVNYASGGSGILNDTGRIFLEYIPLHKQLMNFRRTRAELDALLGPDAARRLVGNALYTLIIGANDFLDNYLSPIPSTAELSLPPEAFINKLIASFRDQITSLYEAGARKIVVSNMPYIGCIPYLRYFRLRTRGQCSTKANKLASDFNGPFKDMLDTLNRELPEATIVQADAYGMMLKISNNYRDYGFTNVDKPCCGTIGSTRFLPCMFPFLSVCEDRAKYFYWDAFHPTQAAYEIIAREMFDGTEFVTPTNVRLLMGA